MFVFFIDVGCFFEDFLWRFLEILLVKFLILGKLVYIKYYLKIVSLELVICFIEGIDYIVEYNLIFWIMVDKY